MHALHMNTNNQLVILLNLHNQFISIPYYQEYIGRVYNATVLYNNSVYMSL